MHESVASLMSEVPSPDFETIKYHFEFLIPGGFVGRV